MSKELNESADFGHEIIEGMLSRRDELSRNMSIITMALSRFNASTSKLNILCVDLPNQPVAFAPAPRAVPPPACPSSQKIEQYQAKISFNLDDTLMISAINTQLDAEKIELAEINSKLSSIAKLLK